MRAALLLLADGRAPAGASAHSFGLESAVEDGDVGDVRSLAAFVEARLRTAGLVEACFAAAVGVRFAVSEDLPTVLDVADAEYGARVASPALAARSRDLGRYLLRLASAAWPAPALAAAGRARPAGWHQPVALGLAAACAGVGPRDAASCALHGLAAGIASAGVRLLGLDPVAVHAAQARLSPACDALAAEAATCASGPLADLPAWSCPLVDVRAERHAASPTPRLFAS
ncbi:MAG TPA: urease accessory UreF family protein [Egibacteraceae bacterium]|nr:urease accessory UreF family protein [Egibacteraceae bacterium]